MDPSTFARLNNLENRTTILGISLQNTERKAKEALTLAQNGAAVKKELEEELKTKIGTVDSTGVEVNGIGAVISGEEGEKTIVFTDENGNYLNVVDPISELALPLTTTGTGAGNFAVDTNGNVTANGGLDVAGKFTVNSDGEVTAASVSDGTNSLSGLAASIDALETTVGDSSSGLVKEVDDLKTTIGDASSGIVQKLEEARTNISNLKTTVGSEAGGLVKDVNTLRTTVGDSAGGLVKDVNTLRTTVGDSSSGLVKDVAQASFKAETALTEVQNNVVRLNPSAAQTIRNDLTLSNGKLTIGSSATDETLLTANGNITSNKITTGEMNINDKLKMNENGNIVYLPNAEDPYKSAIKFDVDENNRVNIYTHNCSLSMRSGDSDYTPVFSVRKFECDEYYFGGGSCDVLEARGYTDGKGIFSGSAEGETHALHDTVIRTPENKNLIQTIDSKVTIGADSSSLEGNRLQVNGPASFSFMRGSDERTVKIGDYDYDLLSDSIRVNKELDFYGVKLTPGEDEIGDRWIQSNNTIKSPTVETANWLVSKGSTSLIGGTTVGDLDHNSELNITDKFSVGTTVVTGYGDPICDESTPAVLQSTVRERKTYLAEWTLEAEQAILEETGDNYIIYPSAPDLPDGSPYDPTVSQATFTVSIKYPEDFSKYDKTITRSFHSKPMSEMIINYCPVRDGFDYTCWIESASLEFTLNAGETYEAENVNLVAKAQYRAQNKYVDIKRTGINIGSAETEVPINVNGTVTSNNINSNNMAIGNASSNGYITLDTQLPEMVSHTTSLGAVRNGSAHDELFVSFDMNAQTIDSDRRDYFRTYGEGVGLQLESDKDIVITSQDKLTIDTATTCTADVTLGSTDSTANLTVNGQLTTDIILAGTLTAGETYIGSDTATANLTVNGDITSSHGTYFKLRNLWISYNETTGVITFEDQGSGRSATITLN